MPVRVLREAWRTYPGRFTGMTAEMIRRRCRRRLERLVRRYHGRPFAEACNETLRRERRASRTDRRAWMAMVLDLVAETLDAHPYTAEDWQLRRDALLLLDCPLHVRSGRGWRQETGRFYQRFMARALDEMAEAVPPHRLRVWKLYNMGFVVKTASATVAFDVHPGVRLRPPLSPRQIARLVDMLDAAAISHPHYDHWHAGFIRQMLRAGKPVSLPFRRPRRGDPPMLLGRREDPAERQEFDGFAMWSVPGWQRGFVRNHLHVVEADGARVMHAGDNTQAKAFEKLADSAPLNLALVNCWAGYGPLVRHIQPAAVVTGHENELGHVVSMRCDYGYTYRELSRLGVVPIGSPEAETGRVAAAVLSWGERLELPIP